MSKKTELESTICEVEKGIKEHGVLLKQKEVALKYAQEDMEEKRVAWTHHKTNLTFMRTRATLIDIKEYKEVLKLLAKAKEEFDEAALKVAGLLKSVVSYRKEIQAALKQIEQAKGTLASMGQVLQFPSAT